MLSPKATTQVMQETLGTLALMGLGTGTAATISLLGTAAMTTGMLAISMPSPRGGLYSLPPNLATRAGKG